MIYGVVYEGGGTGGFQPAWAVLGLCPVPDAEGTEVVIVVLFPFAVGISPDLFKVGAVLIDGCGSGFFLKAVHVCHISSPS